MKKELLEQYKKQSEKSPRNMEKCIKKHLEEIAAASPAFAAKYDEKRFKGCISFVYSCAREILKSKHGEVADDICYKMARDYFEEELWKEETAPAKSEAEETEETEPEEMEEKPAEAPKPEKPKNEKKAPANNQDSQLDLFGGSLA